MDDEEFQELDGILAEAEDLSEVVRDRYTALNPGSTLAYECWSRIVRAKQCLRALQAMNV